MPSCDVEKVWMNGEIECVVVKCSMGHRCGYCGVMPGHVLHGVGYSEKIPGFKGLIRLDETVGDRGVIPLLLADLEAPSLDVLINVHGSITYADGDDYPVDNKEGRWFLGFDTMHSGDTHEYWTLNRTVEETDKFASEIERIFPNGKMPE
jgi:hypothetical protein